jgi:hypothetical protein
MFVLLQKVITQRALSFIACSAILAMAQDMTPIPRCDFAV